MDLYSRHIAPIADTYAYCLLKNHFHLLVRIKTQEEQISVKLHKDPSRQFGNLFNAYAKAINKTYRRTGALFQRPFSRIIVDSDAYFCTLVAYIHQNPQIHGLINDFRDWPYSSYLLILSAGSPHVRYGEVVDHFGNLKNFIDFHHQILNQPKFLSTYEDQRD
jgi:hypothetical protein